MTDNTARIVRDLFSLTADLRIDGRSAHANALEALTDLIAATLEED